VLVAHWYGVSGSAVPWNSKVVASPSSHEPSSRPPENETAASTSDDTPGFAPLPGTTARNPTFMAVMAPAEVPQMAIRSGSMP
jgi:hypothetical protein